jgi:hypothetical protein
MSPLSPLSPANLQNAPVSPACPKCVPRRNHSKRLGIKDLRVAGTAGTAGTQAVRAAQFGQQERGRGRGQGRGQRRVSTGNSPGLLVGVNAVVSNMKSHPEAEPATLSTAIALLHGVVERAVVLRNNLRDGIAADGKSLDHEATIAVHGAALAASANLSDQNIASLRAAIRDGQLPRRLQLVSNA